MEYKTIQITSVTLAGRSGRLIRISGIEETAHYNFLLSVSNSTRNMITNLLAKTDAKLPVEIGSEVLEKVFHSLVGKVVTIGYKLENEPNYPLAKVYSLI